MKLWVEGSTKTVAELKKVGSQGYRSIAMKKPVFSTEIKDSLADAYTLHNLEAATVYKVRLSFSFEVSNRCR